MLIVEQGYGHCLKAPPLHGPDLHQVHAGQDGVIDFQYRTVIALFLEQVAVGPDIDSGVRDDLLPQGIDGRIGYLGKLLLEKAVEEGVIVRQGGQGHIMAHGHGRLCPIGGRL